MNNLFYKALWQIDLDYKNKGRLSTDMVKKKLEESKYNGELLEFVVTYNSGYYKAIQDIKSLLNIEVEGS